MAVVIVFMSSVVPRVYKETRGYPIKIRVKADLAKKNNCECLSFSIASSVQRLRSKISHGNPEVRVPLFTTLTAAEALYMEKL